MQPITAEQSAIEQEAAASYLHARGLRSGDRVALLAPGSTSYLSVVLGALRSGVVPVPLDPRLTPAERGGVLGDVSPALVLDGTGVAEAVRAPGRSTTEAPPLSPVPLARPMHTTSGTTGRPKGVWSGLLEPAAARALVDEERELWGFQARDVHLVLSPLHHSAPLRFATGTLLAGGRVVVPGAFDAATATDAIRRHRPTTVFCVPAHLSRLFAHWQDAGAPDLSAFRLVAHAGAACPPAVKERALELFPAGSVWEFYGSTEGQFTACRGEEWLRRRGTVGRARPGRKLLVDPNGTIWCVVPGHAQFTYWGAPEKTAAAWRDTSDGRAFTVGDLGRLDDDGYLYLEGRREDLIITGGVNVYPVEVENALRENPLVRDVAVFGVEDARWGQRVCAAVVGDATAAELDGWARQRLAPPKRPKEYHTVTDLPHTPTGKVRRLDLPRVLSAREPDLPPSTHG